LDPKATESIVRFKCVELDNNERHSSNDPVAFDTATTNPLPFVLEKDCGAADGGGFSKTGLSQPRKAEKIRSMR
jgi:hypothetical protein